MAEINWNLLAPQRSVGESFMQGMQQADAARAVENQNALAQYQLSKAKREDELKNQLLGDLRLAKTNEDIYNAYRRAGEGKTAAELQTAELTQTKLRGEIAAQPGKLTQQEQENRERAMKAVANKIPELAENATDARLDAHLRFVVQSGLMSFEDANVKLAELKALSMPDRKDALLRAAQSAKDMYESTIAKPQAFTDASGRTVFLDMASRSRTAGQRVPGYPTFEPGQTPTQAAQTQTAAGQLAVSQGNLAVTQGRARFENIPFTGAPAGVAPQAAPQPGGVQGYNYGNIRPQGASTGFQSFASPEAGMAAIQQNLVAYGNRGINTIAGVIGTWAPPNENDTAALIRNASQMLGVPANQPLDMKNPAVLNALTTAIIRQEHGTAAYGAAPAGVPAAPAAAAPAAAAPPPLTGAAIPDLSPKQRQELAGKAAATRQATMTANRTALAAAGYNPATGKDEISELIKKSTGGAMQAGAAGALGAINITTPGAKAIGALETHSAALTLALLDGKLGAGISNEDRKMIERLFGDMANPLLTTDKRLASWEAAKTRMKVLGMLEEPTAARNATQERKDANAAIAAGAPAAAVRARFKANTGQEW